MLLHRLIHPQILAALAVGGHHSTILIADGNYPAASKRGPRARLVSMNLMPGVIHCNHALQAILSAIPIEAISTMKTEPDGPYAIQGDPPVWNDYRASIAAAKLDLQIKPLEKWEFYDSVITDDHILTIQTADQQRYANILLTIGVRM